MKTEICFLSLTATIEITGNNNLNRNNCDKRSKQYEFSMSKL